MPCGPCALFNIQVNIYVFDILLLLLLLREQFFCVYCESTDPIELQRLQVCFCLF